MKDKYINPFTDYGHLPELDEKPAGFQEAVFTKLFEKAQLAAFNPAEQRQYEDSLKYYRDLKNVTDTAREEGREEQLRETVRALQANGFAVEAVAAGLNLSVMPFAAVGGHAWQRELAQYREDFRHELWQAGMTAGWRWRPAVELVGELSAGRMQLASVSVPALGFDADLGNRPVREAAAGIKWRWSPRGELELRAERQSFGYGASSVVNGFMEPESRTVLQQVMVSLGYGI